MRFVYLFALSSLVSLVIGRFMLSAGSKYEDSKNRFVFICGVVAGLVLFSLLRHISWWEVCLQILTILLAAFIGSMLASPETLSLIEDYDEPAELRSIYFTEWFNDQGYEIINEPYIKRATDLLVSIVGLLFMAPLYLICGLLIWLENPGPILFSKHSVGKGGQVFKEYKFRTMIIGSALGSIEGRIHDKRLLRIGVFLRKSHLDELPQLFNILKAEMSLVGPRPLRTIDEVEEGQIVEGFMQRHRVLPGIAGLAQINSGYHTDPKTRLKYDLEYITKRGSLLDFKILVLSIGGTLGQTPKSGYHKSSSLSKTKRDS